jgi:hypothetical protein
MGKTVLTISIDNVTNEVVITSGAVKGGNLRSKAGRRIRWEKDNTVDMFDLEFDQFDDVDGAVDTQKDWPFALHDAEPAAAIVKPVKGYVREATAFEGKIAAGRGVFKYTVKATKGGQVRTLDPIIIVER